MVIVRTSLKGPGRCRGEKRWFVTRFSFLLWVTLLYNFFYIIGAKASILFSMKPLIYSRFDEAASKNHAIYIDGVVVKKCTG